MTFSVVSTFAGCGGSSLGYKMAGGRVLLSVEWDEKAATTYRLNFPEANVYQDDIRKLTPEAALALAGVRVGDLDVLDGSPPCQGFSTLGRRRFLDERNYLFEAFTTLLAGMHPRSFVMENVSGLVKGKMKLIFASMLRSLQACGYRVRCWALNAANYGVPQSRVRTIFLGVREDLGISPSQPLPTVARRVSVQEALGLASTGGVLTWGEDRGTRIDLRKPSPTLAARSLGKVFAEVFAIPEPLRAPGDPLGFLPAPRLRGAALSVSTRMVPGLRGSGLVSPFFLRGLTIGEARRLQSFPDSWRFPEGTAWRAAWRQIGNAVPPLMMRAIATHLVGLLPARQSASGGAVG